MKQMYNVWMYGINGNAVARWTTVEGKYELYNTAVRQTVRANAETPATEAVTGRF